MAAPAVNPFAALGEYELRNLVAHLAAAGLVEQLHRVLELSTAGGRNGWHEARLAHGDSDAYLADVGRAWAVASAAVDVALEVRYALITTTLNSLAQNVPPELLIAALAAGFWSGRRTLAFVTQLQDPAARAATLAKIIPHLAGDLRDEALAALVSAMTTPAEGASGRAEVWALPDELPTSVVDDLIPLAGSIADAERRSEVLQALELRLPDPARDEGSDESSDERPSKAQLETALAKVRRMTPLDKRLRVLEALAPRLPAPLLAEAVEQARAPRSKRDRASMLAVLAPHHSDPMRTELQDEALELARTIRADQHRALALSAVAVRMTAERREAVIDETLESLDRRSFDTPEVIVALAPHLSERQFDTALAVTRKLDEPGVRGDVLAALSEHLPERLKRPVLLSRLAAARAEESAPFRIDAFAALLPSLGRATRERVGREALDAVRSLDSGSFRATHLATLAPHLPEVLLVDAIEAAQVLGDRGPRSLLLLALAQSGATRLEQDAAADVLAETGQRPNFSERARTLVELAPFLRSAELEQALELVTPGRLDAGYGRADYGVDSAKARVIEGVAPYLPAELLPKALEHAETIGYLEQRSQALAALAPYLPPPLLDEALAAAHRMPPGAHADGKQGGWRHNKADALVALAPYLPEPARATAIEEAVVTARAIDSRRGAAEQLVALVPLLPESPRSEVIVDALRTLSGDDLPDDALADALVSLAPYVPEPLRARSLKLARGIHDDAPCARSLVALAKHFRGELRVSAAQAALDAARRVDDEARRVSLLADIGSVLDEPERREVANDALESALTIDYQAFLSERAAIALAPLLEPDEREALLERALDGALSLRAAGLDPDPEKLIPLVPQLAAPAQVQALREALRAAWQTNPSDPDAPVHLDLGALVDVPGETLHAALSPTLRDLVSDSRPFLLQRLCDVVPLILPIGGAHAVESTREAVVAVTAWWP
jgi:tetratricopeptide (TPR) repeat protein